MEDSQLRIPGIEVFQNALYALPRKDRKKEGGREKTKLVLKDEVDSVSFTQVPREEKNSGD